VEKGARALESANDLGPRPFQDPDDFPGFHKAFAATGITKLLIPANQHPVTVDGGAGGSRGNANHPKFWVIWLKPAGAIPAHADAARNEVRFERQAVAISFFEAGDAETPRN
jgi:hypothetical protein